MTTGELDRRTARAEWLSAEADDDAAASIWLQSWLVQEGAAATEGVEAPEEQPPREVAPADTRVPKAIGDDGSGLRPPVQRLRARRPRAADGEHVRP